MRQLDRLIEVITDVAGGRYSGDIMDLTRPDVEEPVRTIAEAMGLMMVKLEAREFHLAELIEQLKEINQKIRRNTIATVSTMARALAARDAYTEGHAERVGRIAGMVAAEIGLDAGETERVELAGLLHDIGKIGFPDSLFLPHDGDNPKEIVRKSRATPPPARKSSRGSISSVSAIGFIRYHHERPDGRGYPERLKGDDIPLGARIIAVADAFDAITTDRPYQKARTYVEALAILKDGAGTKWDADCVAAFERCLPKLPVHPDAQARRPTNGCSACGTGRHEDIRLEPGPPGGAKWRWLKPGVDFSRYKRLMIDTVVFFFAPDSEYKGMDPQELKGIADAFRRQMVETLKPGCPIVQKPAPDAVRLRFAITDLRQNRPVLGDTASEGPLGLSEARPATSWSGTGATGAEMLMFDSMTGEVVAAARDERTTGLKEKFTRWGSAEDAFQFWADRLKAFLDHAHDHK